MDAHLGDQLSACVDGELEGAALAAAERHLTACAECRAAYDDLLRLRREASALDDWPPERDLWPGIAARLSGAGAVVLPLVPRRRRIVLSIPQLAAAAVVLAAVSAGGAILLTRPAVGPAAATALAPVSLTAPVAGAPSAKGVESYDAAIRDLEDALAVHRPQLDTATVRAVQQSLAVIDLAIRQARAALAQDPNSLYLNDHLEHALDRKLELLRRITTLAVAS
jgi:anti-sigma factor RsiW